MSQTNFSDRTHIFGKAPTNSLRERLRQLIHRAAILPIRFLSHVLRPDRKRVSAILFEGSSDEPFCMNPPSPASTSSVQIEFSPPITVRNPTLADTPIASAVISPSRFIHSRLLGSPISMQMDFGPLHPTRAGTNQLPNSRADHADAAQAERSSRGWQNTGQSFGPLTAQEFPKPISHSGPGSRFPDRPDLRHASAYAAGSQAEDPSEPHIPAQNIQRQPELSTVEDSSAAPETAESLGMDTVEDVAEYFSHLDVLTNFDRWGKNAKERRRPLETPSQELPNQISRQAQSSDTSEIMPSSLQVGTESGFSEASPTFEQEKGQSSFFKARKQLLALHQQLRLWNPVLHLSATCFSSQILMMVWQVLYGNMVRRD
ncbi:hypothetical protein OEA41_003428 [Lepraria neglecta]|uniref:Uncharacterized protein n=1 Tax=Lepraria neglecta TaxID=209136 RepID=A0AAD9Z494_9LECA|nr:hypothetical protein OEA41_003428 [Lepraria neglecta]